MKKRTLNISIGIIVVFMFMWGGVHSEAPGYPVTGILQDLRTAGSYTEKAGRGIVKAEDEIGRIGKKIAGIVREVTAYNVGVREQTSETPCIGASGKNLCELVERNVKVCAANFVPLGTTLRIEGYGVCVVLDRMHRRFSHRVDIAMRENEIDEARQFGLRKRVVEAVYNPRIQQ